MRNVILSLPRCGSAWLAAYFGYLHDPLIHLSQAQVAHHSIVDTGAAVDPEMALGRYKADNTVVVVGSSSRVSQSLAKLGYPVGRSLVEEWTDRLARCALNNQLSMFEYSDLFGEFALADEPLRLCEALGEDYDSARWSNQQQLNVQHSILHYSADGYNRYVEWLRAS